MGFKISRACGAPKIAVLPLEITIFVLKITKIFGRRRRPIPNFEKVGFKFRPFQRYLSKVDFVEEEGFNFISLVHVVVQSHQKRAANESFYTNLEESDCILQENIFDLS